MSDQSLYPVDFGNDPDVVSTLYNDVLKRSAHAEKDEATIIKTQIVSGYSVVKSLTQSIINDLFTTEDAEDYQVDNPIPISTSNSPHCRQIYQKHEKPKLSKPKRKRKPRIHF